MLHARRLCGCVAIFRALCVLLLPLGGLPFVTAAHAGEETGPVDLGQLRDALQAEIAHVNQLEKTVANSEHQLNEQKAALAVERRRLDELGRMVGITPAGIDQGGPKEAAQNSRAPTIATAPASVAAQSVASTAIGQAPIPSEQPPRVAPIFEQPGVLTPKGQIVIEPSVQIDHSTNDRLTVVGFSIIPAINIGFFDVSRVDRETYTTALTARYGVTNRFEIEGRIPYVARRDETVARPFGLGSAIDGLFGASGSGLGDIEATGRYQFNVGGPDSPYYIGTFRIKSKTGSDEFEDPIFSPFAGDALVLQTRLPTGSGFWAFQPGITAIVPSDPAVLFGSLSYLYNLPREIHRPDLNIVGRVDPGSQYGLNFGIGLALNDRLSTSMGYDVVYVDRPRINGIVIPLSTGANIGTLLWGISYRMTPKTTVSLTLGVGITRDAPDVQLRLRVPYDL